MGGYRPTVFMGHGLVVGFFMFSRRSPTQAPPTPAAIRTTSDSSVLEVIRWALRGRCRLQPDIRSWLRQVQVTFSVGGELLTVEFTVRDGQPDGAVYQGTDPGRVELVRFDGEDAFEQAMDGRCRKESGPATVDHVLVAFAFATTQRCGAWPSSTRW